MKVVLSICLLVSITATAQNKRSLDSVDKVIIATYIKPIEQQAGGQEPDWMFARMRIRTAYSEVQIDRAITKAQIYYYYSKNWSKFSTALVHYTANYEDKEDLTLMDKNANMLIDHDTDPKELTVALGWMKHAIEKEPGNEKYKATYQALTAKVDAK